MTLTDETLICAFDIADDGTAKSLGPGDIDNRRQPQNGWRWIHLDRSAEQTRNWVKEESGLPELVGEALLDEETRPRVVRIEDGALTMLRGVNLNPGADPDDMVSLRLWVGQRIVISLRRRKLYAIQALRDAAEKNEAPASTSAFMAGLTEGLTSRLADTIETMEERMDDLEDANLDRAGAISRDTVVELRRDIVSYRRFLAPQREALSKLASIPFVWFDDGAKLEIRETMDDLSRVIDTLDSVRERAAILQESLADQAAEQMNRTMYVLSIVAAIFLPLSFVTGLLGINVGGIPGTNAHWAFGAVCVMIVLLIAVQLYIFRRMRWF